MSASIKDVAAAAGVSVGTVSNVLNRPEKVKDWGLRAHYSVATAAKALQRKPLQAVHAIEMHSVV